MPYDKELENYLKQYQENPYSRVFAPLAEAYRKNGMPQDAVEVCLNGIKHHPDFVSGKVALARAYIDLKEYEKARNVLEDVTDHAPENYLAQNLLAETYLNLGNLNDALKTYTYLRTINLDDEKIKDKIAQLEEQLSMKESEQETEDKIEEQDIPPSFDIPPHPYDSIPEFVEPAFELSSSENFEVKKAEEIFQVEEDQDDSDVVEELATETMAELFLEQGHKDKALDVYRKLLEKEPNNELFQRKITELELDLGILKVGDDEQETKQEDFDNEEDALKYAYEDEATNITLIPPPFSPADIDVDTSDFEEKEVNVVKESESYTDISDLEEEPLPDITEQSIEQNLIEEEANEEEPISMVETEEQEQMEEIIPPPISVSIPKPKFSGDTEAPKTASEDEWIVPNPKLYKLEQMLDKIEKLRKTL